MTAYYIGNYYEYVNSSTTKKYYYAGSQRVAMRDNNTLYFLLGDHLGSTAITANSNGTLYTEQRYYPWGDTRYNSPTTTPTAYQYTGQRKDATGLYFYNARYYDPSLGRFLQADTIVPSPANPQSLNRYAYVLNSPLRYIDPTGHYSEEEIMQAFGVSTWDEVLAFFNDGGALAGLWGWLEILRQAQDGDAVTYGKALFDKAGIGPRTNGRYGYPYNGGWFKRNESGQIKIYSGTDFKTELTHAEFAKSHQEYWLYRPIPEMPGNFAYVFSTYASTKHYHASFDASKVDWVDFTLDLAGITADLLTWGIGGRAVNVIQAAKTGAIIDSLSISYGLTGSVMDGECSLEEAADLGINIIGLGIPVAPDVVSLVWNLSGGVAITP